MLPVLYLTWHKLLTRALDDHTRARATLEARTLRDPLTQLPNRLAFEQDTERAIELGRGKGTAFTLAILDVHRFHEINSGLGHKHGDELLCQIARRLREELPHSELVTRLGSDLFGVLLPGVPLARARDATIRVRQVLERPFSVEGAPLEVEGHCGVVVFPEHGDTPQLLLQRAESALRRAKALGEAALVYEAEDDSAPQSRVQLFGMLRSALQNGELGLTYQPKIDAGTGRVLGAEALVVWNHPERGRISPAEFIPLAEQTSLIKPLTAWVVTEAVRQLSEWRRAGLFTTVSVNLSVRNLTDENLPNLLRETLTRYDVPASALLAEVTESAVLSEPDRAGAVIEKLKALGVELSLDDFGTGYSSLTYLRTLPACELKLDRSFVRDVDTNLNSASIVGAVVKLAHDLGLKVVAEGIETAAVYQRVRELGCDVAQGYLFSRPLLAGAFVEFVKRQEQGFKDPALSLVSKLAIPEISLAPLASVRPPLRESLRALRMSSHPVRSDAPST
jgi:diguanylate cyclase